MEQVPDKLSLLFSSRFKPDTERVKKKRERLGVSFVYLSVNWCYVSWTFFNLYQNSVLVIRHRHNLRVTPLLFQPSMSPRCLLLVETKTVKKIPPEPQLCLVWFPRIRVSMTHIILDRWYFGPRREAHPSFLLAITHSPLTLIEDIKSPLHHSHLHLFCVSVVPAVWLVHSLPRACSEPQGDQLLQDASSI